MLSGRLISLIERHEEEITAGFVRSVHHHPELPHLARLDEIELRERYRDILENLGHWLSHGNSAKLAAAYEAIGRQRFAAGIPLDECVCALCLVKDKIIEFLDSQGIDADSLALYAEGQLVRRIGPFFNLLLIHLVRGYQTASRQAALAVA